MIQTVKRSKIIEDAKLAGIYNANDAVRRFRVEYPEIEIVDDLKENV